MVYCAAQLHVASYLGCTRRVAARAKLPTEVGDTVTGPQDQGKPHEDLAAEGGQSHLGLFAAPDAGLQPPGAAV